MQVSAANSRKWICFIYKHLLLCGFLLCQLDNRFRFAWESENYGAYLMVERECGAHGNALEGDTYRTLLMDGLIGWLWDELNATRCDKRGMIYFVVKFNFYGIRKHITQI